MESLLSNVNFNHMPINVNAPINSVINTTNTDSTLYTSLSILNNDYLNFDFEWNAMAMCIM